MENVIGKLLRSMASLTPKKSPRPQGSAPHDALLRQVIRRVAKMAEEEQGKLPDRRNSCVINDKEMVAEIKIFLDKENALAVSLGSLDMAKDLLKGFFASQKMKAAMQQGIIVPQNGKGGLHVL